MRTCTVSGCERKHNARGYCTTHYKRWTLSQPINAPLFTPTYHCRVVGCDKPHHAKGYCRNHYLKPPVAANPDAPALPVWAQPAPPDVKCECGEIAVAVTNVTVGSKARKSALPMCAAHLRDEQYVRHDISYKQLMESAA